MATQCRRCGIYAQHYSMSDTIRTETMFGPSSVVRAEPESPVPLPTLRCFRRNPTRCGCQRSGSIAGGAKTGAVIGDPRPAGDECVLTNPSDLQTTTLVTIVGSERLGDLLNSRGVTWGWFQGGFAPTSHDAKGRAVCAPRITRGLLEIDAVETVGDYIPHHEPFQYFKNTRNLKHVQPKDSALIGTLRGRCEPSV